MPAISTLATPSVTSWSQGDTVLAATLNANNSAIKTGVTNLNSAIADVENNYASASQPTDKPQGKNWYDSGNSLLKVYHTTNGTPVALLDTTYAYNQSLSTAGTATFKVGGKINMDTTAVSKAGVTGTLMTYAVPASTLNATGKALHCFAFGTKSGASSAATLQVRLGAVVLATHGLSAAVTDWYTDTWIIRRATATDPAVGSYEVLNRDDTGLTNLVHAATAASYVLDCSAANTFDINVSSIGALDTVTQEIGITILWN